MLCGEVARRERDIQALQAERVAMTQRIRALDETMAMFAPLLDPAAGGTVRAIAGKYDKQGGLTEFVRDQLAVAGPTGLDTLTVLERAAVRFGIDLSPPGARKRFKDTVLWTLRRLQHLGCIEVVVDSRGGRRPKVWRTASRISFQDLRVQQEALDAQDPHTL